MNKQLIEENNQDTIDTQMEAISQGEPLLAAIGIMPILKAGKLKVSDKTLKDAEELPKTITKRCYDFLKDPGFKKISLDLPQVDFLSIRETLTEPKDNLWLEEKFESLDDPDMQLELGSALQNALVYLNTKLPPLPVSITSRKTRPSDFQMSQFNRALRTVDKPLTVIGDMEMGCLSREQVKCVKAVYPNLYQLMLDSMQAAVIAISAKDPEYVVPYAKLKQLSVLLLSDTVPGDLQTILQDNFNKQEEHKEGPNLKGSADPIETGMSKAQKVEFI